MITIASTVRESMSSLKLKQKPVSRSPIAEAEQDIRVLERPRRGLARLPLDRQFKRRFYGYARAAHVYFSTYLLALLIFFCVSGVVINHPQWLQGRAVDGDQMVEFSQPLKASLGAADVFEHPPLAQIEKELNQQFDLPDASDIMLDKAAAEIIFDYKIPAGYASLVININEQQGYLEYRNGGFWALMGDLHKGRNSGIAWVWLIDLSAVIMVLFAITGLIILLQNKKFRGPGLWWVAAGVLTPIIIYLLWVPSGP